MKILIDMNLTPAWVEFFAGHAIESVHWSTVGDPRALDPVIMESRKTPASSYSRTISILATCWPLLTRGGRA